MDKIKQVIVIRKDLKMRRGKEMAQAAHASMKFLVDRINSSWYMGDNNTGGLSEAEFNVIERQWLDGLFAKIVCYCHSLQELEKLVEQAKNEEICVKVIEDAGLTEFRGVPTITCAAFGPDYSEQLDKITGHLQLA